MEQSEKDELEIKFDEIKQQIETFRRREMSREERDRVADWARGLIAIAEEIIKEGSQV